MYMTMLMYFNHDNSEDFIMVMDMTILMYINSFPVAQLVEHGASNAKIMGSIPRESKSWSNVKL